MISCNDVDGDVNDETSLVRDVDDGFKGMIRKILFSTETVWMNVRRANGHSISDLVAANTITLLIIYTRVTLSQENLLFPGFRGSLSSDADEFRSLYELFLLDTLL